ncbi:hypothetical protein DHEL01_v203393 [Diaporthe helianthi]|uniref:Uncharacterized protein n=1 Tax=Diaporthe helianthi TaxID=158607 RepID=A0A2P5I6T2_DIAHE|nr:hypothetical protein DHEL01_v203393 [Diaporthe helianthi]
MKLSQKLMLAIAAFSAAGSAPRADYQLLISFKRDEDVEKREPTTSFSFKREPTTSFSFKRDEDVEKREPTTSFSFKKEKRQQTRRGLHAMNRHDEK